jgi:hypothetical protein
VELSQEFLIEQFFAHCKRPIYKRFQNTYNGECPVCKEGKSSGRSRRLFYFPGKQYLYCHNCLKSWKPFEWVREVSGLTFAEIIKENNKKIEEQGSYVTHHSSRTQTTQKFDLSLDELPENCIDIEDPMQVNYFKENEFLQNAITYCQQRRLFDAINRCNKFYLSLDDKLHKNRLVLPFYDLNDKIVCYQTRSLSPAQHPKYLTKFGEKGVFNLNNVTPEIPYIFIFEGPIDSMFVKNGVAVASLVPTEKQINQLNTFVGLKHVYVFDNDKNNKQTSQKIEKYIRSGKTVFIWPSEFSRFKDVNEVCCKLGLNEISWKFIVKHSAKGEKALIKQKLMHS